MGVAFFTLVLYSSGLSSGSLDHLDEGSIYENACLLLNDSAWSVYFGGASPFAILLSWVGVSFSKIVDHIFTKSTIRRRLSIRLAERYTPLPKLGKLMRTAEPFIQGFILISM